MTSPRPSREDTAARLMLVVAMQKRLGQVERELRTQMGGLVKVGAVEPVVLPSTEETVGKVSKKAGAVRVTMHWDEVVKWCIENGKEAVLTAVSRWDMSLPLQKNVQEASNAAKMGVWPGTGEVLPDNCFTVTEGAPTIVVDPTRGRPDLLDAYMQEGLTEAGRLLDAHQRGEIDQQ